MKYILIFLMTSALIFSQRINFAILSDVSNLPDNEINNIIEKINSVSDIDFTVILGNISKSGRSDDILNLKTKLDRLKKQYFVIPGPNDIYAGESAGIIFKDLWKDYNFIFNRADIFIIGMNSFLPDNFKEQFRIEDIDWLRDNIYDKKVKKSVFISYAGLNDKIENWQYIWNLLTEKNISEVFCSNINDAKTDFKNLQQIKIKNLYDAKSKSFNIFIASVGEDLISLSRLEDDNSLNSIHENGNPAKISLVDLPKTETFGNKIIWKKNLNFTSLSKPVVNSNTIVVSDFAGFLTAFDLSGKKLWEYDAYGDILSQPVLVDGNIAISTIQGDLNIVRMQDGNHFQSIGFDETLTSDLFSYDYRGSKKIINVENNPNIALIAGSSSGKVFCYDFFTLQELWKFSEAKNMIRHKPVKIKNQIIFTDIDGNIFSVDANSGFLIWKWKPEEKDIRAENIFAESNSVFLQNSSDEIIKIDALLGKSKWKEKFKNINSVLLSEDKSRIICVLDNKILFISSENGKVIKNIDFRHSNSGKAVIKENNGNIFISTGKQVFLIDSELRTLPIFDCGSGKVVDIIPVESNKIIISDNNGNLYKLELADKNAKF